MYLFANDGETAWFSVCLGFRILLPFQEEIRVRENWRIRIELIDVGFEGHFSREHKKTTLHMWFQLNCHINFYGRLLMPTVIQNVRERRDVLRMQA